jgi:hypothetical protein
MEIVETYQDLVEKSPETLFLSLSILPPSNIWKRFGDFNESFSFKRVRPFSNKNFPKIWKT